MNSPRWTEITPSEYAWEREALDYVKARLPDHEPLRAWSNFEFIAEDGSINEVEARRACTNRRSGRHGPSHA